MGEQVRRHPAILPTISASDAKSSLFPNDSSRYGSLIALAYHAIFRGMRMVSEPVLGRKRVRAHTDDESVGSAKLVPLRSALCVSDELEAEGRAEASRAK